jgi:hypothetical protein
MADSRSKLFQYAVVFHPKATKDEVERGIRPKSVVVTDITTVLAGSEQEVAMLAARSVGTEYVDHLEDVEVLVRPF